MLYLLPVIVQNNYVVCVKIAFFVDMPNMNPALKIPPATEESVQMQVAKYLRLQYPHIIFRSDFSSGARMSWGLIKKNNAMQGKRGFPDMFIAEPAPSKDGLGEYCGLFLELKREGIRVFKKDGTTFINEHFKEQFDTLTALNKKGYYAVFAFGFEQAKNIIDGYLNGQR